MIIKGLFRRYERWNPVHPTMGAFWGIGIGVGCGVGWGPGFGPEVIGYVGAGCGLGFSVGFTLAGVGIGLPANGLLRMTYNAFAITSGALDSARSTTLPIMRNMAKDSWYYIAPCLDSMKREACETLGNVKSNMKMTQPVDLIEMKKVMQDGFQSAVRCIPFKDQHVPPGKGRNE